jgi:hypothetical protein
VELPLLHRSRIQQKRMSIALDRFCLMESLAVPAAVLLPVSIGVGGCRSLPWGW